MIIQAVFESRLNPTTVWAAELIQLLGPGLGDFMCKNRVNIFQIREMFASTELLE